MTQLFAWIQKVTGGDETRATAIAFLIVLVGVILLAITIYRGLMALLFRLPTLKERCPRCGRRTLAVCWCDENDEDGSEYAFFRCSTCEARYRQQVQGVWEDASDPQFDAFFKSDPTVRSCGGWVSRMRDVGSG